MKLPTALRDGGRRALDKAGVLDAVRAFRRNTRATWDRALRDADHRYRDELPAFRARYERSLSDRLNAGARPGGGTALVHGSRMPTLESELAVIKSLQLGGYEPTVVLREGYRGLRPYYELAGVRRLHELTEFGGPSAWCEPLASEVATAARTLDDLLAFEYQGIRVGRIAVSSFIRKRLTGTVDLADPQQRRDIERTLAMSLAVTDEARRILDTVRPELVLFWNTEYTPNAELFDLSLARGLDVIAYDAGQRTNTLIFKRFRAANRTEHLTTLSRQTWDALRQVDWTPERQAALDHELQTGYESGDWYRARWTQAHASSQRGDALRARLGLTPDRKAAFIFAHIVWDAPTCWGRTLFTTYEEWLIETVRAACRNPDVDWFVKLHPANRKAVGFDSEAQERTLIRTHAGELPPHVRLLDSTFDVTTVSLFEVMDYCLTVRGTVGLEAARLGIPVLVGGEGRYGGKGFTIDSESRDDYRHRLAHIQEIAPLSDAQRTLAERYAYGFFLKKPFTMSSVTWDYGSIGRQPTATIHVSDGQGWCDAPDITSLAHWLSRSSDEDFLTGAL